MEVLELFLNSLLLLIKIRDTNIIWHISSITRTKPRILLVFIYFELKFKKKKNSEIESLTMKPRDVAIIVIIFCNLFLNSFLTKTNCLKFFCNPICIEKFYTFHHKGYLGFLFPSFFRSSFLSQTNKCDKTLTKKKKKV